jgi:hypothetical protein
MSRDVGWLSVTDISDKMSVPLSRIKKSKNKFFLGCLPTEDGTERFSETSAVTYQSTLLNIWEERRCYLHRGERLKSRTLPRAKSVENFVPGLDLRLYSEKERLSKLLPQYGLTLRILILKISQILFKYTTRLIERDLRTQCSSCGF